MPVLCPIPLISNNKNAYNSEDYQAALTKLDGGADRFLFVIEGA